MKFLVTDNHALTPWVWSMTLEGKPSGISRPGQFVQVQVPGFYLRRPISVCQWDDAHIRLVYKVVGQGTEAMAQMKPGQMLEVLTGLGNGFDVASCGDAPLLVGGGVGLPPLLGLAQRLQEAGKHPQIAVGFGSAAEVFLREDAQALGVPFHLATMDGSAGVRGLVTAAMAGLTFDSVCACGPEPMLRAVYDAADVPGQFSFEERMGCGFGACMGCTCRTKVGPKRICKDGPVLEKEEIVW